MRRILRRFFEVFFGHLQVVSIGYMRGVPDPLTYHLHGVFSGQFRFSCTPKVLEQLRLQRESCPLDNLRQLRSQIRGGGFVSGYDSLTTENQGKGRSFPNTPQSYSTNNTMVSCQESRED